MLIITQILTLVGRAYRRASTAHQEPVAIVFQEKHFVVIDNGVLVLLTEYYCERNKGLRADATIQGLEKWIKAQLDSFRINAIDGQIHVSDLVAGEYLPGAGRLASAPGLTIALTSQLQNLVLGELNCVHVDAATVGWIRGLGGTPATLGAGLNRLSDPDLSLVVLALDHTRNDTPAFILTLDQDLLSLVAWARTQREVMENYPQCNKMQGLHCLAYVESLHRDCTITSDDMADLIGFELGEYMKREELSGTRKGRAISNLLMGIHLQMVKSMRLKNAA